MKESGIVRKLDNLGRLVIPKEIRRCMRIKEGSPIEFGLLPSGEIVLSKYSLVGQISDYADDFCEVLGEVSDLITLITDRDKVLSAHGISKKNTIGCKLSSEVLDILDSMSCYTASKSQGTTVVPLLVNDSTIYYGQIIMPIVISGEVEGAIILCNTDANITLGSEHVLALKLVAKFLSKQME